MISRGTVRLSDGESLAYEVDPGAAGARGAPPILLLRPLGGSMRLWGAFRDCLARQLGVVVFDALGSGSSAGTPRLTTRRMAADALELLDVLAIPIAHVYGQSLGGMVATWLARDAPSRVGSLVLASTAARGVEFGHAGLRRGLGFARCLMRPGADVETCLARRVVSRQFIERQPEAWARVVESLRAQPTPRRTLIRFGAAGAAHDARDQLGELRTSTLVLGGELDTLLGLRPQQALAEGLPRAELEVLAGAGHDVTIERPEAVAERVLAFVAEARAA